MSARLVLLTDANTLQGYFPNEVELLKNRTILGRGQSADVTIAIRANGRDIISRQHCEVILRGGEYYIHDMGAVNGVYVNGTRIDEHLLQDKDIIQLGGVVKSKVPIGEKVPTSEVGICIQYRFHSNKKRSAATTSSVNSKQARVSIDIAALTSYTHCHLCHDIMVDAVVAPCSHSFCRACYEQFLLRSSIICPQCNTQRCKQGLRYVRCEALDNIIWMLQEASGDQAIETFQSREKAHYKLLKQLNIDPLAPIISEPELPSNYKLTSKSSTRKSCEYCGEVSHSHKHCPYDDSRHLVHSDLFSDASDNES